MSYRCYQEVQNYVTLYIEESYSYNIYNNIIIIMERQSLLILFEKCFCEAYLYPSSFRIQKHFYTQ